MPRTRSRNNDSWSNYGLGFVFCVLFPGFVTAIAPISVTYFQRQGQEVVARSTKNLLFLIPYRRVQIDGVTAVGDRFHEGEFSTDNHVGSSDTNRHVKSEDEAFLVIHGRNGQAEVSVSPVNIGAALGKARAFLANPAERELRLVTVANWKFSVIAGGLVSLLTMLYLIGVVIGLWRFIVRLVTGRTVSEPAVPPHKWKPR